MKATVIRMRESREFTRLVKLAAAWVAKTTHDEKFSASDFMRAALVEKMEACRAAGWTVKPIPVPKPSMYRNKRAA